LAVGFGGIAILDGLSFEARRSELTVIIGPSGSGKTSVLKVLAGLMAPLGGHVNCPNDRAILHQDARLVPFLTVEENLRLAMELGGQRATQADISAILETVGIAGMGSRLPPHLSGGEKQRAAFARVVATRASVLLIDEPTASLDRRTAAQITDLVSELARSGSQTVIVATHDPVLVTAADKCVDLSSLYESTAS
jgi:ABC-type lipoprotein export system ATPase subunit